MMQSLHLLRFDITANAEFLHFGGTEFLTKQYPDYEIDENVEDGGRHPYLRSDQPD